MRSTFLLLKDIQAELVKTFAEFPFDSGKRGEDPRPPHVWIGHAPPKQSMPAGAENKTPPGDPPFIIIRFLDDEDKNDNNRARITEARIGILCCVYSKDGYEEIEAAYHDIMNMMDRVLLALTNKAYWENNYWWRDESSSIKRTSGLQKELGSIYEAGTHEHPYYGAAVIATFKAAAIARPPESGITRAKEN